MNRICVLVAVALALLACSRDPKPAAPAAAAASAGTVSVSTADESVAAVLQSPGKAEVTLRFVLAEKPVVGRAGNLRLDLAARDVPRQLQLHFTGNNLSIDPKAGQDPVTLTETGVVVSRAVAFTPQAPGLADLVVHITSGDGGAPEMIYAVPLLVDAAAETAPAKP